MAERLKDIIEQETAGEDNSRDKSRDKLRKKRKKDSQADHLVFIKSICPHRVTVKKCKNHKVIIEKDTMTMLCESILGTERKWTFMLDKFFKAGILTIDLTERWFNLMMINIAPGSFEVHKKRLVLNRRNRIEFTDIAFEEVATWNQKDDYST